MCSSKGLQNYRYLTPDGIQALLNFQYAGADHSLLYKYILSPLAQFFVDNVVPTSIAPNSITLFGFSFMIFSCFLISAHCPTFDHCSGENTHIPSYIFLVNGLSLLIYQTLDNMDGKQARKTGSSSPLGLMFDHGLDAWNIMVGTMNTLCALGVTSSDLYSVGAITISTAAAFYIATWEEYHTHKLELPIINGPNEGVLCSAVASFITFAHGTQIWDGFQAFETVAPYVPDMIKDMAGDLFNTGVSNKHMFCTFLVVSTLREICSKILYVVSKHGIGSLTRLAPFVSQTILSVLIVQSNAAVFEKNQRIAIFIFGVCFVESVTGLMLDHMTRQKFDPFRVTLVPIFILYYIVDLELSMQQISQFMMIAACGMSSFVMLKSYRLVGEICDALGIWCFDITTPHPNKKKN
ncbi:hypothetical protein CTEN210_15576 [Chaetoceros tenuissimus]|uniref:Uncharacterized protein n=1 Tax=Chaetoceros tenuissimus TaxID=426638 RepID=A0AAD3D960_9STRA|nr:hypothetical protein CTEN210_15576 [Chaetoceros tenuissimus]